MEPQIRYCTTSDGVSIAWAEMGAGPPLLYCGGEPFTHVQEWSAMMEPLYGPLARSSRLIWFDARGTGMSERDVTEVSAATLLMDAEAVINAAQIDQFAMLCWGNLLPLLTALQLATEGPARVTRLVLHSPYPSMKDVADTPYAKVGMALAETDWPSCVAARFLVLDRSRRPPDTPAPTDACSERRSALRSRPCQPACCREDPGGAISFILPLARRALPRPDTGVPRALHAVHERALRAVRHGRGSLHRHR